MNVYKNWRIIAAVAQNGVIGSGLNIPWHISEEFKHFKATTMGGVIVMGRRTWESLNCHALSGRENVVISSTLALEKYGEAKVFKSLEDFSEFYKNDSRNIWICGGASLYKEAMKFCSELILSIVKLSPEGDVFFPDYSADFVKNSTLLSSEKFDVISYTRICKEK